VRNRAAEKGIEMKNIGIVLVALTFMSVSCSNSTAKNDTGNQTDAHDADAQTATSEDAEIISGDNICIGACELKSFWPRLIVGLFPSDDTTSALSITGEFEDGSSRQGIKSGCPSGYLSVPCSFSIPAGATDKVIVVHVKDTNGTAEVSSAVTMMPFNQCGHEISYVRVTQVLGVLSISQPEILNPCASKNH